MDSPIGSIGSADDDQDLSVDLFEAISNARNTSKVSEKLQFLTNAREIVLHRDPSHELLRTFAKDFVGFRFDKKAPVRLFVIKFIEDACSATNYQNKYITPLMLHALLDLTSDTLPKNRVKVWVTAINMFRPALKLLCNTAFYSGSENLSISQALAHDLSELGNAAVKELSLEGSKIVPVVDVVKTIALSYLRCDEDIVAIEKEDRYRPKEDRADTGPNSFSLDMVPGDHPVLSIVALEKVGSELVSLLSTQLENIAMKNEAIDDESARKFVLLSNAVQVLTIYRPSVREQAMTALVSSAKNLHLQEISTENQASENATQGKLRAVQNLRTVLLDFLKEKWRVLLKDWRSNAHEALCFLGARKQADKALNDLSERDDRTEKRREREIEQELRRRKEIEHEEEARLTRSRTHIEASDAEEMRLLGYPPGFNELPWEKIQSLKELSAADIAEIVVENMEFLPGPPPATKTQASDRIQTFAQFVAYLDRETSATHIVDLSAGPAQAVLKLKASDSILQRRDALHRMLELHSFLAASSSLALFSQEAGAPSVADAMIARVACNFVLRNESEMELDLRPDLIRFIAEDLPSRIGLAISALFHIYLYAGKSEDYTQYDDVFMLLVEEFILRQLRREKESSSAAQQAFRDKSLSNLFTGVPRLPRASLVILYQFCETRGRHILGLKTLRDLIKNRTQARKFCLDAILFFCCCDKRWLREPSVRCLANQVYATLNESSRCRAEEFAFQMLEAGIHVSQPKAGEDGILTQMQEAMNKEKIALLEERQGKGPMDGDRRVLERIIIPDIDSMPRSTESGDKAHVEGEDISDSEEKIVRKRGRDREMESITSPADVLQDDGTAFEGAIEFYGDQAFVEEEAIEIAPEGETTDRVSVLSDTFLEDAEKRKEVLSQHVQLYIALCRRNHALLSGFMDAYAKADSEQLRNLLQGQIQPLIYYLARSIGPAQTLGLFQSFPDGSESLLIYVLKVLANEKVSDSSDKRKELVEQAKAIEDREGSYMLFDSDDLFVIPLLGSLRRSEIVLYLVRILSMDISAVRDAIYSILTSARFARQAGTEMGNDDEAEDTENQPFLPLELLVLLVCMPESEEYSLKNVIDATEVCLARKDVFTKEVLIQCLSHILEIHDPNAAASQPLPKIIIRLMIRAVEEHPQIKQYIAKVLTELLDREVWNQDDDSQDLFKGFVMCALKVATPAYPILLRLPIEKLEYAMDIAKGTAASKIAFFARQNQQNLDLSPEVLEVIGKYAKKVDTNISSKRLRKASTES